MGVLGAQGRAADRGLYAWQAMDRWLDDVQIALAVRSVGAWGLPGAAFGAPDRPLDADSWRRFTGLLGLHRIWGILANAIAAGDWPATDEQYAEAAEREAAFAGAMIALDRTLLEVAEHLERAGINWRLLKGPAAAQHLWANRWLRPYSDIDVLVPGEDFDDAVAELIGGFGAQRTKPDPAPGYESRVGKGTGALLPSGVEVDLHRMIMSGSFGVRIPAGALFADPLAVDLPWAPLPTSDEAGVRSPSGVPHIPTLAAEALFVHSCFHAVTTNDARRLVALRDIAEGLAVVDRDALTALAQGWGCGVAVAQAVRRAVVTFALRRSDPLIAWANAYRAPPAERLRWVSYSGRHPSRHLLESSLVVWHLDGWADRLLYVRGLVFRDGRDSDLIRVRRQLQRLVARRVPDRSGFDTLHRVHTASRVVTLAPTPAVLVRDRVME